MRATRRQTATGNSGARRAGRAEWTLLGAALVALCVGGCAARGAEGAGGASSAAGSVARRSNGTGDASGGGALPAGLTPGQAYAQAAHAPPVERRVTADQLPVALDAAALPYGIVLVRVTSASGVALEVNGERRAPAATRPAAGADTGATAAETTHDFFLLHDPAAPSPRLRIVAAR